MSTSVDRWKGLIPVWLGIAIAWGGTVVLAVLLEPLRFIAAIVAATVLAVVAIVLVTRRLLTRDQRTLITTMDLRRRPAPPSSPDSA